MEELVKEADAFVANEIGERQKRREAEAEAEAASKLEDVKEEEESV
jgi:hypothetical protein